MKRHLWKKLIILAMIILSIADKSLADDSVAISVTCTIPIMPGINAPLIESAELKPQTDVAGEQKNEIQKDNSGQTAILIQQDAEKELISQEEKKVILVKTYYSR
jgi:hypothetical protein